MLDQGGLRLLYSIEFSLYVIVWIRLIYDFEPLSFDSELVRNNSVAVRIPDFDVFYEVQIFGVADCQVN